MSGTSPPRRIGPYRVEARIGTGGMGVVYRVVDEATGARLALKTLVSIRGRELASLRREIHALSRMEHPGIVRIIAQGVEDDVPWYAMELVEGTSLRARLAGRRRQLPTQVTRAARHATGESPTEPATLDGFGASTDRLDRTPARGSPRGESSAVTDVPDAFLEAASIVRRLCEPLAYLHGEGIVHRDLKPENVLLRPDGRPVLIDFGLTSGFGGRESREILETAGDVMGTAPYVAPEQARGELVDARADLYSLGCILYELLVGRPPFHGDSTMAVIRQHLEVAPRPPSQVVDGLPPALDELVLRLLAKRPRDRVGHADDVAFALEQLGAPSLSAGGTPPPRAYLYRPNLAGRTEAYDNLAGQIDALKQGRGGITLVGGESGIGKTRLCMEVAAEARRRRVRVVASPVAVGPAEVGRPSTGFALAPVLATLVDALRDGGPEAIERLLGPHAAVLAPFEPALGRLPGVELAPPVELRGDAARQRLLEALASVLLALAAERPLLLILDDVQGADGVTLGLLHHLAGGELASRPLLVVGTHRAGETPPSLRALAELPTVRSLALERLHDRAVAEMVAGMLAIGSPPARLVRFVADQSEGNPLFVGEYLQAAVERGVVERSSGRWEVSEARLLEDVAAAVPLPVSLRKLLDRRLETLSPAAATLLSAAAVRGSAVSETELVALADLREDDALGGLEELLTRHVMTSVEPGRLWFSHDKIREAAYERTEPEARRGLHRRVAERLTDDPESAAVLGRHWEQAGETLLARAAYLRAAGQTAARFALDDAEALYRAYLSLVPQPTAESVRARNALSLQIYEWGGRTDEGFRERRVALAEALALGDVALATDARRGLATLHRISGELPEARACLEEALASVNDDVAAKARLARDLGGLLGEQGRFEEAERWLARSLALAREGADREAEGVALSDLALVTQFQGRMEAARSLYAEALAIHRAKGNVRFEATTLLNLATLEHVQAHLAAARRLYAEAREKCRLTADRRNEASAIANLADIDAELGLRGEAATLYEEAIRLQSAVGEKRNRAIMLGNLATLHVEEGRPGEARALSEQAVATQAALGDRRLEVQALVGLGVALLAQGELAAARARLRDAAGYFDGENPFAEGETLPELVLGLLALGEPPERLEGILARGMRALETVGDALTLAKCRCEEARLALHAGRDGAAEVAAGHLAAARAAAADLGMAEGSRLLRRIESVAEPTAAAADPDATST